MPGIVTVMVVSVKADIAVASGASVNIATTRRTSQGRPAAPNPVVLDLFQKCRSRASAVAFQFEAAPAHSWQSLLLAGLGRAGQGQTTPLP